MPNNAMLVKQKLSQNRACKSEVWPQKSADSDMDQNFPLRYASPDEVVRLAKESGMTTVEIVRVVSGCLTYREALKRAHEFAPLLEISVSEFMQMRRNE